MATTKVKGTNAKIKELKGIKPEKVTDEQLKKVQDSVNNINRKLILFFYNIADSMTTIHFLPHSIMHSVILIIFAYGNFTN